jgi:hypothetical protein
MRRATLVFVAFLAIAAARAADTDYKRILVEPAAGAVEARLPLTDVSGPARVKRKDASGIGVSIAPTKTTLDESCYLEWQISYDTTNPQHWSAVRAIRFEREGRTKYGCELSKLISEARTLGLLSDTQLRAVREELNALREVTLEEKERLVVEPDAATAAAARLPNGFERHVVKTPAIHKMTPHGRIEIQLKPKQRAVGYQAMVYACIPFTRWERAAGPARSKETVRIRFTGENADYLLDLVRAFGLASREHNDDLGKILDALLLK